MLAFLSWHRALKTAARCRWCTTLWGPTCAWVTTSLWCCGSAWSLLQVRVPQAVLLKARRARVPARTGPQGCLGAAQLGAASCDRFPLMHGSPVLLCMIIVFALSVVVVEFFIVSRCMRPLVNNPVRTCLTCPFLLSRARSLPWRKQPPATFRSRFQAHLCASSEKPPCKLATR